MRIPDIGADPRAHGFPPNHPPMHSFLGAPVIARGLVFGNIYLTEKQGASEFSEEDEAALVVLAIQAGVAIENARLYAEKELAQRELARLELLEERERIAKELHDGVIQSLFAVGMGLQGTAAMSPDEEIGRRLEGAVEEIDRAIRDLRNYIFGLRPGILADRQLGQALEELGQRVQRPIRRRSRCRRRRRGRRRARRAGGRPDPGGARGAVERGPSRGGDHVPRLAPPRIDTGAVLEIDDDGTGFDVDQPRWGWVWPTSASGCRRSAANVAVESLPGEGTTVRARPAVAEPHRPEEGADRPQRQGRSPLPSHGGGPTLDSVHALLHRTAGDPGAGERRPGPSP